MTFISPNKSVSFTNAQNRLLFFTENTTRCNTFHTAVHPKRSITNHTAVAGLLFLSISSNEPKQKFSFPFQQQVVVATFGKPKKTSRNLASRYHFVFFLTILHYIFFFFLNLPPRHYLQIRAVHTPKFLLNHCKLHFWRYENRELPTEPNRTKL